MATARAHLDEPVEAEIPAEAQSLSRDLCSGSERICRVTNL
jgi:hypothetical protein